MATEVKVPDIGDFDEVPVIEILVSEGDEVEVEQALVTLESDKATMDVPSPEAGTVKEMLVSVNDKVSEGTPIVVLEGGGGDDEGSSGEEEDEAPKEDDEESCRPANSPQATRSPKHRARGLAPTPPRQMSPPPTRCLTPQTTLVRLAGDTVYAGPGVRRMARELGVDLANVKGSGRKGRILKEDVKAAKDKPAQAPTRPPGFPASISLHGPRLTSRSTARSSGLRCRASRRSQARRLPGTG